MGRGLNPRLQAYDTCALTITLRILMQYVTVKVLYIKYFNLCDATHKFGNHQIQNLNVDALSADFNQLKSQQFEIQRYT